MAPPIGASDSILVVRRHGASLEPYYGALAPYAQNNSMETNEHSKIRRTWGDKASKNAGKGIGSEMIETSGFMVHPDYLHKYGTLNNGVLTKSIKHAEALLYGSVGMRGASVQRPSLFLYPGMASAPPRILHQAGYVASSGAFINAPVTNYPSPDYCGYVFPSAAHKHVNQHFAAKASEPKIYSALDFGKDALRPSVASSACKKCGEKKGGTCTNTLRKSRASLRDVAADPYNLMRKSRLGMEPKPDHPSFGAETIRNKKRNASASPMRNKTSSSSFETFKAKQAGKEAKQWAMSSGPGEWETREEETARRKSILECEVNAYELNESESRGGLEIGEEEVQVSKAVRGDGKSLGVEVNKTEARVKDKPGGKASEKETPKTSEVRLNGQTFKIFDRSEQTANHVTESYASASDEDEQSKALAEESFPKRPPRRQKEKHDGVVFKYSKARSKSSPNLSIKSILKKPGASGTGDDLGLPDLLPEEHQALGHEAPESPKDSPQTLPTVQNCKMTSQSTLKKKKQVQFKVSLSNEPLEAKQSESREESEAPTIAVQPTDEGQEKNSPAEGKSSPEREALPSDAAERNEVNFEIKEETRKAEETGKESFRSEENLFHSESTLKRSYSDRRPAASPILPKNKTTSASNSLSSTNLFSDTMALRTKGARANTRDLFVKEKENYLSQPKTEGKSKMKNVTVVKSNSVAKGTKKLSGNLITYAEFSKLTDSCGPRRESDVSSARKTKSVSRSQTIVKAKAPSPPRRSPIPEGSVSVKVPATKVAKGAAATSVAGPMTLPSKTRPPEEPRTAQRTVQCETEVTEGKTVVRLNSVPEDTGAQPSEDKRSSVTISSGDVGSEQPQRRTSVIISNFHPQDSNIVTISVRSDSTEDVPNSSSCTIIETGSNSTVIPVVSTDNKTTLIVGNNATIAPVEASEGNPATGDTSAVVAEVEDPRPEEEPTSAGTKTCGQYVFSTVPTETEDSLNMLDPVEAVKRNLVPHVCGKESKTASLMEKMKHSREAKAEENLKQISQLFSNARRRQQQPQELIPNAPLLDSLIASYRNRKTSDKNSTTGFRSEEISSAATSRSNSFCSTLNSSTSRSSSFRSSCYKGLESDYDASALCPLTLAKSKFYVLQYADEGGGQEKDKLECEYEVRSGFKDDKREDTENIYEVIKEEPIYDQIGPKASGNEESEDEVPPPLPLSLPPTSAENQDKHWPPSKSMFEGASKYDILNYLVDAKDRVQEDYFSGSSVGEDVECRRLSSLEESGTASPEPSTPDTLKSKNETDSGLDAGSRTSQLSYSSDDASMLGPFQEKEPLVCQTRKSSAEIERNDSGVGSETSHTSRSKWQASSSIREDPQHLCEDCDQIVEMQITDGGVMYVPLVCRKCTKKRSERKEIIQEIVETEEKYGRDLKIILEEFYKPMLVAGLLTPEQLSAIFLNTEELLENSELLTERLRDTLEIALEQGDEDLLTVNIGKLFIEAGPMLHAFESYCTRQGAAAMLLANLEKEKELLRIFLRVSQMENSVLRRMNLNSFLMVPVQRVTKYPLLLARLYKVTPSQQEGKELLREAQHNIELHLEHMNSEAKDASATKVWRRFSTSNVAGRKSAAELEMINIKLRKMAVDVLDWNHEEVRFVMEGKLLYTQPTDSNWKRGRTIKLTPVFVLLVTLGKPNSKYKIDPAEDELTFPTKTGIREATLLLVKEKGGRYTLIREPLFLDKIIVCCETELEEYFEIQELSTKDSFIFKAEDGERTKEWYKQLQYHAQILGAWRKRRNALANIMINGMMARAYTS